MVTRGKYTQQAIHNIAAGAVIYCRLSLTGSAACEQSTSIMHEKRG